MSGHLVCRGCGRRVRVPDGVNPRTARCSKCRAKLAPPAVQAGLPAPPHPPDADLVPEVLSLDDAEPVEAPPSSIHPVRRPGYRRPWWLAGVGALLALGTAAGPVMLAEDAGIDLWVGLVLGAVFVTVATAANTAIALRTRLPVGGKVALMTGVGAAVLAVFVVGAMVYFADQKEPDEPPSEPPVAHAPGSPTPTEPSNPPPEPQGPPTHFDLVYRQGKTRLDDGPADVTALAVSPHDTVAVGYADGSTLVWALDQATFEPPRTGPRADGAVRRIEFDPAGKFAFVACDAGLVAAPFDTPPHTPLLIPGEHVAIRPDPNRERFAAVRAGRLHVRYAPMDLAKDPPAGRAVNGFVVSTPKDETIPFGGFAAGTVPPGGVPTFLTWHPAGRLLCGRRNGTITAMPTGTPGVLPLVIPEHKAAIRAWAVSAGGDFATGDDDGFIGYWPEKSMKPTKFKAGAAAIRGLAFNPRRRELAAVDAAGWMSVWHPASGTKQFAVKPKAPPRAVAYGPNEDLLMIADGKGVEVWWLPALAGQAETP